MESGTTNHELIKYFDYDDKVPSCSAFYQQRSKLLPDADSYRYICKNVTFDYVGEETNDEYPMSLHIVRFEVADGIYENILTNLPGDEFPIEEIRQIYHLR